MSPETAQETLAQPTRARLFALLGELGRPTSTAELADHIGLHRNGVRAHLAQMSEAGLVERARRPDGRGRPPDTWVLSARAREDAAAPEHYRQLGRWLARALGAGGGTRGIERTGREIGHELAAERGGEAAAPADQAEALERALTDLGFRPERAASPPGTLAICLGNCPFRDAVRENQPAVCTLHRGITAGLVDSLAPEATLTGFVPHDPDDAGCTVEITGLAAAPAD